MRFAVFSSTQALIVLRDFSVSAMKSTMLSPAP